jgi:hypothetical protein
MLAPHYLHMDLIYSIFTPLGLHITPHKLHLNSIYIPYKSLFGVYLEFTWSLSGVCGVHIKYMESTWSPYILHTNTHVEFKWSPHGGYLESRWSLSGVCGVHMKYMEST